MRKLFLLALGTLILSCSSTSEKTAVVDGSKVEVAFENVPDGTEVYFTQMDAGDDAQAETTTVQGGKAAFTMAKSDAETLYSMAVAGGNNQIFFINDNTPLKMTISQDGFRNLTTVGEIEGGESNKLFNEYLKRLSVMQNELSNFKRQFGQGDASNFAVQSQIMEKQVQLNKELDKFRVEAIEKHPTSLASVYILADVTAAGTVGPTKMNALWDQLSDGVKNTPIGRQVDNTLHPAEAIKIGDVAPDFSAPTPDGKTISLKDVLAKKGKVTIVEFWASWCPHCQHEMPNVVRVYNKYHQKGLNIISVSVDDQKAEWEKGIKDFGMNWDQVSNLSRWDDPIIYQYGVKSIPSNYILDENGKVIAMNLKDQDLEAKMAELLD